MELFAKVLRTLGNNDPALIEQTDSGLLLPGPAGERLIEHYSFYAVFNTPEEFRLIADGRELGTLPIDSILTPGTMLIFSGRRWLVQEVHDQEKVIIVKPAKGGVPPVFGGDPGDIHDRVIAKMFQILEAQDLPVYMDSTAAGMLSEAREHYDRMGFRTRSILKTGGDGYVVATRVGSVKNLTLALALKAFGCLVEQKDGFLFVETNDAELALADILDRLVADVEIDVFDSEANLLFEKFHPYLNQELLREDALASHLDIPSLRQTCIQIRSR
ncbi:hypothetical protein D5687_10845 [Guyparkeria sp. SCN-R1]|nr:hypothetical protein D5687_10845 [Guyparkeria sp. SCN-R1]